MSDKNELAAIEQAFDGGLAAEMRDMQGTMERLVRNAGAMYWESGDLLRKARELVPHGSWGRWLEARGLERTLAFRCMRISERYTFEQVSGRSVRGLLADLTEPAPVEANVARATNDEPPPPEEQPELPATKPKQEVLTDEEAPRLTRVDRLLMERDAAAQELAEERARAAEAARKAEIAERRAEAAEAAGGHAQVAGAKVAQAESRADRLGYDLAMEKGKGNDLRQRLASKTRTLLELRKALEALCRGDELVAGALEPVLVKFFGERKGEA